MPVVRTIELSRDSVGYGEYEAHPKNGLMGGNLRHGEKIGELGRSFAVIAATVFPLRDVRMFHRSSLRRRQSVQSGEGESNPVPIP